MAEDRWTNLQTFVCKTCQYFVPKAEALGRCRRHAPRSEGGGWPAVYETDWCGDHKIGKPR